MWSNAFERRRPAATARLNFHSARSKTFTTVILPDRRVRRRSTPESEVAPRLPPAFTGVREEREPLDVEPGGEVGQVLVHLVEVLFRDVLRDRDVRVVREPGLAVQLRRVADRGGDQLALADAG